MASSLEETYCQNNTNLPDLDDSVTCKENLSHLSVSHSVIKMDLRLKDVNSSQIFFSMFSLLVKNFFWVPQVDEFTGALTSLFNLIHNPSSPCYVHGNSYYLPSLSLSYSRIPISYSFLPLLSFLLRGFSFFTLFC